MCVDHECDANIPQTDKNFLIPQDEDIVRWFCNIQRRGVRASIVGNNLPGPTYFERHIQGVAIPNTRAVLTRNTYIMWSGVPNANLTFPCIDSLCENDSPLDHLGGIQTIGDWFVVGFENGANSQVRFYKFEDDVPILQDHLTIYRTQAAGDPGAHPNSGKASSVGITNYCDGDSFRYVLAVCPRDDEIHFYRTNPNFALSNGLCSFGDGDNPCIWRKPPKNQRYGWVDQNWGDYTNGISLLATKDGKLYLVGFNRSWGRDFADLYRLELDNDGEQPLLTKIAKLHVKCVKRRFYVPFWTGPSFRWGGSAFVTQEGRIRFFACERNIHDHNTNPNILMNIFHRQDDNM